MTSSEAPDALEAWASGNADGQVVRRASWKVRIGSMGS